MSHISIRQLNVDYGSHQALRDISLEIPDSQITAIIGPSGCGKTTLLKSVNRLIDLQEGVRLRGQVLIDGQDICASGADLLSLRKKVGFLSQRPFPLPMSIYDNIAYGPRIHHLETAQIQAQLGNLKEWCSTLPRNIFPDGNAPLDSRRGAMDLLVECYLRMAGLWPEVQDRLGSPAARLSVGQQQRLALARALAIEPEVILADAPTSALDPVSARLVEQQFHLLKNRYTIVIVTHILRQARRLADYVVFLYLGELVEHGPAAEVFQNPRDERTAAYIHGEIS